MRSFLSRAFARRVYGMPLFVAALITGAIAPRAAPATDDDPAAAPLSAATSATAAATEAVSYADESAAARRRAEDIIAMWVAHRTDVATVDIRYLCFNGSLNKPGKTSDLVLEIVRRHDLANHPENLPAMVHEVMAEKIAIDPPYEQMRMWQSGIKRRADDERFSIVRDGEIELRKSFANRHVSVTRPGQSAMHCYNLTDLRWSPPIEVPPEILVEVGRENGVVHYLWKDNPVMPPTDTEAETWVDEATGIVRRLLVRRKGGAPVIESIQDGIREYPGGIFCPATHAHAEYVEGRLRSFRVMLVQEAHFNEPVDDDVFVMAVSDGMGVTDRRGERDTGFMVHQDLTDLRTALLPVRRLPPPAAAAAATAVDSGRWRWLLVLNGVIFLALGLSLWRQSRRKPSA